jgi:hypothetical protein
LGKYATHTEDARAKIRFFNFLFSILQGGNALKKARCSGVSMLEVPATEVSEITFPKKVMNFFYTASSPNCVF